MKTIGIIGLGLLGTALADRLLSRGWSVAGFDVDANRREHLHKSGGETANCLSEIASFDFILLSLPTSQVVAEVVSSLKPQLRSGQTIVDTTTGNPAEVESTAAGLAEIEVDYLDATVGGSSQQARDGDVIIMCGGQIAAFERCRNLFDDLATRTFHLGPVGNGSRMKLAVNLILGLNRAVLAEGLCFAKALGLDPATALEVFQASPAWSQVMETKGEKMLNADFAPQARVAQHLKDVRVILKVGASARARLPLSELHQSLLQELVEAGMGHLDNSAIIEAFKPASHR